MDLEDFDVTDQGQRPIYGEGEIEVVSYNKFQFFSADNPKKPILGSRNMEIILTTHRILFVYRPKSFFKMLHLGKIFRAGTDVIKSGFFKSPSHRMKLNFDPSHFILQFHKKSECSHFFEKLIAKINEEKWKVRTMDDITKVKEKKPALGGILEIKRRIEQEKKSQDQALREGFQDVDSLMKKAGDLVLIAEQLSNQSLNQEDDKELQEMLQEVGITKITGVTKLGSGSKFYEELARELCDFLHVILKKNKGMVPLTDVYMIYNRARGTDLVSPEDILKACSLFEKMRLPLELRDFKESKVKIVMDRSRNKQEVNKQLFEIIGKDRKKRVNVVSVSKAFNVSILLAKIILEDAEINDELLIRDEAPGGNVYFYKNYFHNLKPLDYNNFLKN